MKIWIEKCKIALLYRRIREMFTNFCDQIIVLVGTKLELVIMEMAQQIQDRTTVVRGAPLVEPTNNFFWFNRPEWILFLIHFTLFMVNALNPLLQ